MLCLQLILKNLLLIWFLSEEADDCNLILLLNFFFFNNQQNITKSLDENLTNKQENRNEEDRNLELSP